MASDKDFVEFVVDQLSGAGDITYRHMFGEFGLFCNGKIFALICDNKFFLKPTEGGRKFIKNIVEAPPYPGAKNSFLIEERLEDREWLTELVKRTVDELPERKRKRIKRSRK